MQSTSDSYSKKFGRTIVLSIDLQNPDIYNKYYERGFRFIRKYHIRDFTRFVRNPTIGCWIELFCEENIDCVKIDSKYGIKLINKLCYF